MTKSKDTSDIEVDNSLIIRKLNQDILDLEMNNNELKQQIIELENIHEDISTKVTTFCFINVMYKLMAIYPVYSITALFSSLYLTGLTNVDVHIVLFYE